MKSGWEELRRLNHPKFDPLEDGGLTDCANRFFDKGLARSSRAKYRGHVERFASFARENALWAEELWESTPSEMDLIMYVTHRAAQDSVQPGTIKGELAALTEFYQAIGQADPTEGANGRKHPRLHRVMRGISRTSTKAGKKKREMTVPKTDLVRRFWRRVMGNAADAACLESAVDVGVHFLLRVSEFTSPTQKKRNPRKHLNGRDVTVPKEADGVRMLGLFVKKSKADIYREGADLVVATSKESPGPMPSMKRWLAHRKRLGYGEDDALYRLQNGDYLTREKLQKSLQAALTLAGLVGKEYTSHSLRAGGATSLAAAGMSDRYIQVVGRWASDCYKRYIRIPDRDRVEAARGLAGLKGKDLGPDERVSAKV